MDLNWMEALTVAMGSWNLQAQPGQILKAGFSLNYISQYAWLLWPWRAPLALLLCPVTTLHSPINRQSRQGWAPFDMLTYWVSFKSRCYWVFAFCPAPLVLSRFRDTRTRTHTHYLNVINCPPTTASLCYVLAGFLANRSHRNMPLQKHLSDKFTYSSPLLDVIYTTRPYGTSLALE